MNKIIINTDGAARGNPGPAAASFVIKDETGSLLIEEGSYIGTATNNEAEYTAVKLALEKLAAALSPLLPVEVEVRSDSQLIVNQLSGSFKIKNERLKIFVDRIRQLEEKIGMVAYIYVPRAENSRADALGNVALDSKFPRH